MEPGRTALVTGAASGIGRAIAGRLVEEAHSMLSVDLESDEDGPGTPHFADLTTVEVNRRSVEAALEESGGLDLLVPCAGFEHFDSVSESGVALPMDLGWSAR